MQDSREGGRSHDEYDRNAIHRRTAGDPGGKDMENKLAENIRSYRKNRGLTQEQLAATLMPLGGLTKEEVRSIAAASGLPVRKGRSAC